MHITATPNGRFSVELLLQKESSAHDNARSFTRFRPRQPIPLITHWGARTALFSLAFKCAPDVAESPACRNDEKTTDRPAPHLSPEGATEAFLCRAMACFGVWTMTEMWSALVSENSAPPCPSCFLAAFSRPKERPIRCPCIGRNEIAQPIRDQSQGEGRSTLVLSVPVA